MAKLSGKEVKQQIVDGHCGEAVEQILVRLKGASQAERATVVERLGEVAQEAYDDFAFANVETFLAFTRQRIGKDIAEVFERKILDGKHLTHTWHQKLLALEPERHARNLREHIRGRDTQAALESMLRLIQGHTLDANFEQRLKFVGGVLGSLPNDQPTVERFLELARKEASRHEYTAAHVYEIAAACRKRMDLLAKEAAINRESEYAGALTRLTVELRSHLPSSLTFQEVSVEEIQRFSTQVRAIIRTAFVPKRPISWRDLCDLFVEFVPAELSAMGARAGVEGRLYNLLSPAQQMTARHVFAETGKIEAVRRSLLHYAASAADPRDMARAAETMGLLAHPEFGEFLQQRLSERRYKPIRSTLVGAIGRLGSQASTHTLVDEIRRNMRGAATEGPARRRALDALKSLGEFLRSSQCEAEQRSDVLDAVIDLAPRKDDRLALEFAMALLPAEPRSSLTPDQRSWFVETLTRSLWLGDETPTFAGGKDNQRTMLGWREPIVDAIERFGEAGLPDVALTADSLASRFSGAYLALAEIARRYGTEILLPALRKCLVIASAHDDEALTRYARETYYDPTDGLRKALGSRMAVADLVGAIHKIGGPTAEAILAELYQKVRQGEVEAPGDLAAKILVDMHLRSGAGEKPEPRPAHARETSPSLSSEAVEAHIKELTRFHLIPNRKKRRASRIPSILALAEARPPEAIEPLLALLNDGDKYIAAAAANALKRYGEPSAPPDLLNKLLTRGIEKMETGSDRLRNAIADLLIQINPTRGPIKKALERELTLSSPDSKLHRTIRRILERESADGMAAVIAEYEKAAVEEPVQVQEEPPEDPSSMSHWDKIMLRRQYFEKRRAWIQGGKAGSEPVRPPGV